MGSGHEEDCRDDVAEHEPPGEAGADSQSAAEASEFDAMDTTSWSGSAPPVLIEDEEETIVSASVAKQEAEPELDPESQQEAEPEPEPVTLPPGASAEAVDEEPTLLSSPIGAAMASAAQPDEAEPTIAQPTEDLTTPRTIAPSASLPPLLLERIEPSKGRGERIRLDVLNWHVRLGRAEESEIRLYTASASREHALIAGNEEGQWIMTPSEGRNVFVDGEAVSEPTELEVGMNLVLGKDHLRCVIEGLGRRDENARTATEVFEVAAVDWSARLRSLGPLGLGALVLGVCALVVFAFWLGA